MTKGQKQKPSVSGVKQVILFLDPGVWTDAKKRSASSGRDKFSLT